MSNTFSNWSKKEPSKSRNPKIKRINFKDNSQLIKENSIK